MSADKKRKNLPKKKDMAAEPEMIATSAAACNVLVDSCHDYDVLEEKMEFSVLSTEDFPSLPSTPLKPLPKRGRVGESADDIITKTNSGKRGVWVYEIGAFPDFKGHKNHIHQHPVSPDIQHKTDGIPQKMHGKVSGRVFVGNSLVSVDFGSNYLHSYVGVNGSTLYVAIRGIPLIVGFSLQPLIGEIIGVKFKRQANVTFQPGGERLTIILKFKGIDEHGHLMVDIRLKGKIAEVPQRAKVCIQPYTKIYNYSINLIISSSTRVYVISLLDD
ncbi:hypothetical protein Q8A67_010722 [Cirrhinus molitorella]|uniref:Nidogen G2 beta-barrel domain-containing protein n=1 Tax=Cirrhinus molitorella TaxID=172907 RepID=A0AA88PPX1_9TELE|nr:hypothetical protein Q8A67_010722 [Cirrhinus molitorella]